MLILLLYLIIALFLFQYLHVKTLASCWFYYQYNTFSNNLDSKLNENPVIVKYQQAHMDHILLLLKRKEVINTLCMTHGRL